MARRLPLPVVQRTRRRPTKPEMQVRLLPGGRTHKRGQNHHETGEATMRTHVNHRLVNWASVLEPNTLAHAPTPDLGPSGFE